jgi:nucleoid DNA-binding protein
MAGATKMTKTQFLAAMAERSGLDKRQVNAIFDALQGLIKEQLSANGPGELTILNLLKLKVKETKATEDREGIHPITKQPQVIKGKPASRRVRATPMKGLKDLVAS